MTGRRANGEGSTIRFDATRNKYEAKITQPGGKRKTIRGDTEKEVRLQLHQTALDIEQGVPIASNKLTLKRFLSEWLAGARLDKERRPTTLRGYAVNIDHISASSIAGLRLGKVQPRHVQTLLRETRAKGLSERSVAYIHATLRVALADAVEMRELATNPAQAARRKGRKRGAQDKPKFKVQPLNKLQVQRLLNAARGERLEALFVLAVLCGLRRGELLGLRWSDVDLDRQQLRVVHQLATNETGERRSLELVEVKTHGSARIVDLPASVVLLLRAHRARQDEERRAVRNLWLYRDLVFCSEFGAGIETTTLYRVYKRIRERAGITARLHDLRHTAVSLMLAQGIPLWDVSKIIGHSSYQFTLDTYGHLYAETRRTAADAMDRVLSELLSPIVPKIVPTGF